MTDGDVDMDDLGDVDEEIDTKIAELKEALTKNPYDYDSHVAYLGKLRQAGELDDLRIAREKFAEIYPLTPTLWLEWIEDERKVHLSDDGESPTAEGRIIINKLFERAVVDYPGADAVWLEYIQFSIGAINESVRELCERAITACGHRMDCASLVWSLYRMVAMLLANDNADKETQSAKELFNRQLAIAHIGLDDAIDEYKQVFGEPSGELAEAIQKAERNMTELNKFEDIIGRFGEDTLPARKWKAFQDYIAHEQKAANHLHAQQLYERAILCIPTHPDVWFEYASFAQHTLKSNQIAEQIYSRGTRNCTSCSPMYERYLLMCEMNGCDYEKIKKLWETAVYTYTNAHEGSELWLTYVYIVRRYAEKGQSGLTKESVVEAFGQGKDDLINAYGLQAWDPRQRYREAWAVYLTTKMDNVDAARELWADMKSKCGSFSYFWERWFWMERLHGDTDYCRKLLLEAVKKVRDFPNDILDVLEQFERDQGTAETLQRALILRDSKTKYYGRNLKRDTKHTKVGGTGRDKDSTSKLDNTEITSPPPQAKKMEKPKKSGKSPKEVIAKPASLPKTPQPHQSGIQAPPNTPVDSKESSPSPSNAHISDDGFLKPQLPPSNMKKRKLEKTFAEPEEKKLKNGSMDELMEADQTPSVSKLEGASPEDQSRTVFVSNLDFATTEQQLRKFLTSTGVIGVNDISEISFAKQHGKMHGGFGHVTFSDDETAKNALTLDRKQIGTRPVFVSAYIKDASRRSKKFDYQTNLEKQKLFVRELRKDVTVEDLRKIFGKYGTIKDIRLVTYRSGASKGMAYVEFETEADASQALVNTDNTMVKGRKIQVAISNPPPRRSNFTDESLNITADAAVHEPRKSHSSKLQLFAPRAVSVPKQTNPKAATTGHPAPPTTTTTTAQASKLSNQQFREMFMKK